MNNADALCGAVAMLVEEGPMADAYRSFTASIGRRAVKARSIEETQQIVRGATRKLQRELGDVEAWMARVINERLLDDDK
ncbi:MAG: hypothetical protein AAF432_00510 [Planctomycetota bacterium]